MGERRVARTMCPMNCHPTLCGMLVEVEDGRLVGVRGDPDNPDSQGFLCVRGQASREIIGNPKRIVTPMLRTRRGQRRLAGGRVGRGAGPDRLADDGSRTRGGRTVGRPRSLRQQLRDARRLASAAPLRQFLRLPVVESDDHLLGTGRLRPRAHRGARGQHEGGYGRQRRADPPLGRQPREPAQYRPPPGGCAAPRRPRRHHRRARDRGGGPVRRGAEDTAGHRRGPRARHDARDHRRGATRPRLRGVPHRRLRGAGRARPAILPGVGGRGDGPRPRAHHRGWPDGTPRRALA